MSKSRRGRAPRAVAPAASPERGSRKSSRRRVTTAPPDPILFVVTIGLSAFLLFTLELLAGRLVLPVFGGSPAVWTTALCFFTGVVFVGYLYAHIVVTRLGQRIGGVVHLVVAVAVIAATIVAPTNLGALRDTNMPEALNVLVVLAL